MLHSLAAIKLGRELELEVAALKFEGWKDGDEKQEILKNQIVAISCQNGNDTAISRLKGLCVLISN